MNNTSTIMSTTGPYIISGSTNTYELIFDCNINYCNQVQELFETIRPILGSAITTTNKNNKFIITLKHNTPLVAQEVDMILLYLTAIYYDCYIYLYSNEKLKYIFHAEDGNIRSIEELKI